MDLGERIIVEFMPIIQPQDNQLFSPIIDIASENGRIWVRRDLSNNSFRFLRGLIGGFRKSATPNEKCISTNQLKVQQFNESFQEGRCELFIYSRLGKYEWLCK